MLPMYPHTAQTDLSSSVWDSASAEGSQNFHADSEEYSFSFGLTPRHDDAVEDLSAGKWMTAEETPAVVAEPMRRISSRSSTSSKYRTIKATQKTRPRILSTASSQGSSISSYDMANAQMEAYLLESDAHSVSSNMFYPTLPMSVGMSADGLYAESMAPSLTQQHMDPNRLHFDISLAGSPPTTTWSSPLSESRVSSPAIDEFPVGASPTSHGSPPMIGAQSPNFSYQPIHGLPPAGEDMYGTDPFDNAVLPPSFSRRPSGDGESARDHYLYKNAQPGSDGLFHCPWEGQASCNHKAEKLKCNYDKFVDSHLKPYRCKADSCENARFSSTACLLRHEREAHAMHGHGDKPYLCTYDGCDRAIPGCGFPRNWNLRDHMRRVHNDNGQSLVQAASAPASARVSQAQSVKGRKRKSKDLTDTTSRKGMLKTTSAEDTAAAAKAAERPLIEEWWEHHSALHAHLQRFDQPLAFEAAEQNSEAVEHFNNMEKITRKLKKTRELRRVIGRTCG